MNTDLKIIKKKYGEEMSRLCRELFPTLLEEDGLLSTLMLKNFAESHSLYDDIIKNELQSDFKNYIYNISNRKRKKVFHDIIETPEELLDKAGYTLYKCDTEEDIQSFKKYYAEGEELCTFNDNRLERCHVFFAVKKNVDSIKRENFPNPRRQDEYGTSVISIQFTKDDAKTLSIKNRYNHRVSFPDATFSNDLENIVAGLEDSFAKTYGMLQNHKSIFFEIPNYVRANDGKYYKYNYEMYNSYYCPNNVIISNFEVKKYPKEKYIVLDYFILDLVNKKMLLSDNNWKDSFIDGFNDINKISIENNKDTRGKKIIITNKNGTQSYIALSEKNTIQSYYDGELETVGSDFLSYNRDLQELSLPKVQTIKEGFLYDNINLQNISLPSVRKIGNSFLMSNETLREISLPNVEIIGEYFLGSNTNLQKAYLPNVQKIGGSFLMTNNGLQGLSLPKVVRIGNYFLDSHPKKEDILSSINRNDNIEEEVVEGRKL